MLIGSILDALRYSLRSGQANAVSQSLAAMHAECFTWMQPVVSGLIQIHAVSLEFTQICSDSLNLACLLRIMHLQTDALGFAQDDSNCPSLKGTGQGDWRKGRVGTQREQI